MKSQFLLLSVLVCGSASFLSAGSYSYTALVDGSSTWNRPVENGVDAPFEGRQAAIRDLSGVEYQRSQAVQLRQ